MPRARNTTLSTHMGGEGAPWIGQAPFTTEKHVFQNLGDGTLSTQRPARDSRGRDRRRQHHVQDPLQRCGGDDRRAAGRRAASMSPEITRQVAAEGAKKIVVVTDEPEQVSGDAGFAAGRRNPPSRGARSGSARAAGVSGPHGARLRPDLRRREAQAPEARDRGPTRRSASSSTRRSAKAAATARCKSNCISVRPLETEFGRKRTIDQSNCNKDYSCIEGFCPSFVTVHGGAAAPDRTGRAAGRTASRSLTCRCRKRCTDLPYGILVTGIGGTGVLTVGALLGMAAHLEGRAARCSTSRGSLRKRRRDEPRALAPHARGAACGAHRSRRRRSSARMRHGGGRRARRRSPPRAGEDARDRQSRPSANTRRSSSMATPISTSPNRWSRHRGGRRSATPSNSSTRRGSPLRLMGDSIATNLFMLGYAFQKGRVPARPRRAGARDRAQRRCR